MFPPTETFGLYLLSLFITLCFPRIDKTFYSSASILSSLYLLLNHLPIKLKLINLLIWHIFKNAINLPFILPFNIMKKVTGTPHPTPVLGSSLFIIALCWQFCSPFSVSSLLLPAWTKLTLSIRSWDNILNAPYDVLLPVYVSISKKAGKFTGHYLYLIQQNHLLPVIHWPRHLQIHNICSIFLIRTENHSIKSKRH